MCQLLILQLLKSGEDIIALNIHPYCPSKSLEYLLGVSVIWATALKRIVKCIIDYMHYLSSICFLYVNVHLYTQMFKC